METESDNAEIFQELGWAYSGVRDFDRAKEYSIKATELNPRLPIPFITLAEILILQKKEYGECYSLAETAFNLDPNLDLVIAIYGTASFLVGKIDQSVSLLKKASEISPDKAFIRHNLAIAYSLSKQFDLAFQEFQIANKLEPSWHTRHMVFSSYLAQFNFFQNIEHYSWVITIGFFVWVTAALAMHSVFLLLFPTIFFLFLTSIYVYSLIKSGFNWRVLGGVIFGAIFSGLLIYLIYLTSLIA